jgi:ParB family protein of integrating conjugative element (PFGI_1 class)
VSGEAVHKGSADAAVTRQTPAPSGRHVTIDERRRLVAESLRVGNPGNNARELPARADPRHDCQIELAVDDIRPYENNPRRAANAKFAEIKESIRSSGIRNPLTVTRRPGDEHFIVEAGGNTRLLAVQELWAETRDARFQKLVVLFRPWRSESHVLTSHLIENELRGEMTFWDKATGVVALKARLEAEKGRSLSLRQLEDEMKSFGLSVNTATLAHSLFATERLRTLGEAVAELSGLDVKTIQPRLNLLKRYAQTRATIAEDDLYETVFEPVFREVADGYRQSRTFSATEVCGACEQALARRLGERVEQLRDALHSPERQRHDVAEKLPVQAGSATSRQTPAAPRDSREAEPAVSTANADTADATPQVSGGNALADGAQTQKALSALVEQVRAFAKVSELDTCLRVDATAPLGYYMDALSVAADGEPPPSDRHRAWRLLALLAGQLDADARGDLTNSGAESTSDAAMLRWLLDSHDEAAGIFWNVLTLARQSGACVFARDGSDIPKPPQGDA